MLRQLAVGERNISELAAPFEMSFVAAAKHVRVLEAAGLIRRRRVGRSQVCTLEPRTLATAAEWLGFYERLWSEQFAALDRVLAVATENDEEGRGAQ